MYHNPVEESIETTTDLLRSLFFLDWHRNVENENETLRNMVAISQVDHHGSF